MGNIGIVGSGLVGSRVAQHLTSYDHPIVVTNHFNMSEVHGCDVVVLAHGAPHAELAATLLGQGCHVVSCCDDLEDTMSMLDLVPRATSMGRSLVVGATCSPGMTGLLVSHVSRAFDLMDEVHVAVHGTGGPRCAHQHHKNLAGTSVGWHEGEWLQRPAGSGRELCWFPDPVNARDCYRHASAEPILVQRIAPQLRRITARVSATRRDRLTARLPMLSPPHKEGGIGALRVEARGSRNGVRHVEIVGMAERIASVAAAVSANVAHVLATKTIEPGVHALGAPELPNADILDGVLAAGHTLHQFVGT